MASATSKDKKGQRDAGLIEWAGLQLALLAAHAAITRLLIALAAASLLAANRLVVILLVGGGGLLQLFLGHGRAELHRVIILQLQIIGCNSDFFAANAEETAALDHSLEALIAAVTDDAVDLADLFALHVDHRLAAELGQLVFVHHRLDISVTT